MRLVLLTSEPLDVARGSGTAMSLRRLRAALALRGVTAPVLSPPHRTLGGTLARGRFNRSVRAGRYAGYDAVLGVGGDGWRVAAQLAVPFIVLIKAMYSRALRYERGLTAAALRRHAHWERDGIRRADCVVAPSHDAADAAVRDYGADPTRLRVIPEPFDAAEWTAALPARERWGTRVLCVAHMYPRKRVGDLVDAWPEVVQARPDARLDIVGDGPELRRIARHADDVSSVFLHGHVEHPQILEFFARADAFCLPSAQETFGYAVVEAMASGLTVVVADTGALAEVTAGAIAEYVTGSDAHALATALLRSLEPDRRREAASVNPARARAFSPEAVADSIIAVVDELRLAGR